MKLHLDPKLFNPLFYKYMNSKADKVISLGGSGSGKSYSMCQYIIYKCLTNKDQNFLCVMKELTNTKAAILDILVSILKKWKIYHKCKVNLTEKRITFPNGSSVFMRGCDNVESLKSLMVSDIFIEEANNIELSDYQQIELRLRGQQAKNGRIFILFNPVSKNNWLYDRFFGDGKLEGESVDIFHTTYRDNKFLTEKDKRTIENYKKLNYNHYRVYGLGEWGLVDQEGIFYNDFNAMNNCSDISYNPLIPLTISFDSNTSPYISLIVSQIYKQGDRYIVRVIKNYAMFGANLYKVLAKFKQDFINHEGGMFVCGDSSSNARSVFLEQNENFYSIILQELAIYHPVKKVISSNPSVMISRMFINRIFRGDDPIINISIDYKCKELIDDLENLKVTPDGGKDKSIFNNKTLGMKYEKHGHQSDALSYLVIQTFYKEFVKFKMGAAKDLKLTGRKRRDVGY